MDLATIGTAIGIADGISSLFGGGDTSIHEQYEAAEQHVWNNTPGQVNLARQMSRMQAGQQTYNLRQKIKAAEANGINPTLLLGGGGGIPAFSSASPTMPSITDTHASNAGSLFSQILQMNHEKNLLETELAQENEELRERLDKLAEPDEPSYMDQYGDILPLPSEAGRNGQDSNLYRDSASAGPSPFPSHADDIGLPKRDVYNLYVDVYDPQTDRWMSIPNPDLMDAGPIESAYALSQIGAADLIQNKFGWGGVGRETYADQTRPQTRPERFADINSATIRDTSVSPSEILPEDFPDWGTDEYTDHMRRLYQ